MKRILTTLAIIALLLVPAGKPSEPMHSVQGPPPFLLKSGVGGDVYWTP